MISTGRARKPAHPFSRFILGSPRPLSTKRSRAHSLLLASTALTALISAQPAEAGTPVWTGAFSSDWFLTSNWNPTGLPNASDTVTIDQISPNATAINGGAANALSTYVGAAATGQLTISNGGTLTDSNAALGFQAGSTGIVTVTGSGSTWTNTGDLSIGRLGSGTLQVLSGGSVSAANAYLGDLGSNSSGSLTVSGAGSSFTTSGGMVVGNTGTGSLTIANGGQVTNNGFIGAVVGGIANGTASVDGASSSWSIPGNFIIGDQAQGSLSISNGATVTASNTVLGFQSGGVGGLTVSGAGSSLTTGSLTIGYGGGVNGLNYVAIGNGGSVTVTSDVVNLGFGGAVGVLYIGAGTWQAAAAPGTLNASLIQFSTGANPLGGVDFNHTSSNYVFSSQFAGNGDISQFAGVTQLTADSSGFTGRVWVIGGTLAVTGSIANATSFYVAPNGTLAGTGTIGSSVDVHGGILAPGFNGTGTLNIQGSLVMNSAATYLVQVSPASATSTDVTGTATLGGATVNAVFAPGTYITKQYTIVHATGGISGTFGTLVNTNLPSGFTSSLSQDANNAYLNLTLNLTPGLALPSGLNVNQQNVATSITNFFNAGGSVPIAFGGLTPAGLTQLSGEVATGSQRATFNAMGLFLGLLTDPVSRGDAGVATASGATGFADEKHDTAQRRTGDAFAMAMDPSRRALFEQRWSVWTSAFGGSQSTNGNATIGSNDTTSRIFGGAVGADYLFSPNTYAGFALAGGSTNFSVTGSGYGRSDLFQAGAYVRHTKGPAYVTAALAYGWQDVTTDRTVTVAGIDRLRANFQANAYSGRVEGGYRVIAPWTGGIGITPYAAAQVTMFDLPGYAETVLVGTGTSALTYAAKSVTDARSELGVRTDKSFAAQDGVLTLRGRFAWAHDFNPDRSIAATFQALPGASFVVNGAAQATDAALVTAAAEKKWLNGWVAAATFEGEFSNVTRSYAGKGVVRYQW
ncbi:autotransporter domain-containing protein [Bradyrhizobium sp. Ec3.3]|uniref:autotransporter outer membrane beta-barrel domain-containing protein n=1 Tax=Bradyrhizobium sp. Ec3.3 TaxID=189753 RepID=UPI0018DB2AC5|nr:autotransporter domain-containing protein [Bradyrhizobium sp. Ec3.3]